MEKYPFLEEEEHFPQCGGRSIGTQMYQADRFCGGKTSEFISNDFYFLNEVRVWVISRCRGCVGGLRKKEMIWYSHLIQMKKFNRIPELSCLRFLNSESVILAL